ncbi:MAG: hypothetical protein ACI8Q6_003725, partial [Granulosicoccus sp.]
MSAFGRSKEHVFKGFLNLMYSIPSHDTFSTVFRMIDPKALDAAFGQVLAKITALLGEGDVIPPPLVLCSSRLLCDDGATARHVIYDGQWRGSDRSP